MQASVIITIATKYRGHWPYSPGAGAANDRVTWESYTRAFLLPWVGTLCAFSAVRAFRDELTTFYMAPCALADASHVRMLCTAHDESGNLVKTQGVLQVRANEDALRFLEWQLLRLVFCPQVGAFTACPLAQDGDKQGATLTGQWALNLVASGGLTTELASKLMRGVQGTNEISIEVPGVLQGCIAEFCNFFYIYQLAAVTISFYWDYVSVGLMFTMLVLIGGFIKVYTERQQRLKLRSMADIDVPVWCKRAGAWAQLPCAELCVGDVVCVCSASASGAHDGAAMLLAADALVVEGNTVVDESLLTGETMPIQKFQVSKDSAQLCPEAPEDKKNFLFAGTQLLHATGGSRLPSSVPEGAIAVVSHVGPRSCRGGLLRTLLFGAPLKLAIHTEAIVVLVILFFIGMCDFLAVQLTYSFSLSSVISACFLVVLMISPLLGVAILGGQLASAQRLSAVSSPSEDDDADGKYRIFVRDVDRMSLVGKLDIMCFDKTGTITKSGLDLVGVVPISDTGGPGGCGPGGSGLVALSDEGSEGGAAGVGGAEGLTRAPLLSVALAVTHTVSRLKAQLIGHQVEVRMVEMSQGLGARYSDDMKLVTLNGDQQWRTAKEWTFDHRSMTMSVVAARETVKGGDGDGVGEAASPDVVLFVKGSFEAIAARCRQVLPPEWANTVDMHSSSGCYVISVACRQLSEAEVAEMEGLDRDKMEAALDFLGLIIFRNEPKVDSSDCLEQIRRGGIDSVMVTGDSARTGIAIARTVGLVPARHRVLLGSMCKTKGQVTWQHVADPQNDESHASKRAGEGSGAEPRSVLKSIASEHVELSEGDDAAAAARDTAGLEFITSSFGGDAAHVTLAVTGEAFETLLSTGALAQHMTCRGCGADALVSCSCMRIRVFGRMTPHQKVQVVRYYAMAAMTVGMCGDGGNDSGALRAAHAGLSLGGSAEASVAAPFSTDSHSLGALVLLLREGRASLCTSFAAYRFLVIRGIVWTQATNIMYFMGLYLAPLAYLLIDLLSVSVLMWAISQARPATTFASRRPEGSLFGPQNVLGSTLSVCLYMVVLGILLGILFAQPWFKPYALDGPLNEWQHRSDSFESPLVFVWSAWFTIDLALVCSKGHTHRLPLMRNHSLLISSTALAMPVLLLLFMDETDFNCAFKVNCDRGTYLRLKSSWVNNFLFPYEQIGGEEWYAPDQVATTYSAGFKAVVVLVLVSSSAAHQFLYGSLIFGSVVQDWMPHRFNWDDKRAERLVVWMSEAICYRLSYALVGSSTHSDSHDDLVITSPASPPQVSTPSPSS